jgi:hypothetical protein
LDEIFIFTDLNREIMEQSAQEFMERMMEKDENITMSEIMIEFAKGHVRSALTSAHNAAVYEMDGKCWSNVYNRKFIFASYPEDKIK